MNITLNSDCNKLTLSDDNITDFLTYPENYLSATITTNLNCCSSGDTSCVVTVTHTNKYCIEIDSNFEYTYNQLLVNDGAGGTIDVIQNNIVIASGSACNDTDYSTLITEITQGYLNLLGQNVLVSTNYIDGTCYLCIESADQNTINAAISIHGQSKEGLIFLHYFIENTTIDYGDCIAQTIGENTWYLDSNNQYSLDTYNDGVYTVTIELQKTDESIITIKNCYTILCKHKCIIAKKMDELKEIDDDKAIKLYLIYTALLNGNNCECDCSKLCEMYEYLLIFLGEINNFNCDEC